MKRVYLAGPMGPFDGPLRADNIRTGIDTAESLLRLGVAPWVPHLGHIWESVYPHDYEAIMAYDAVWLRQCEALFRMPGESPGADREVALAKQLGIPVFTDMAKLRRWLRGETPPPALEPIADTDVEAYNREIEAERKALEAMSLGQLEEDAPLYLQRSYQGGIHLDKLRIFERVRARKREAAR